MGCLPTFNKFLCCISLETGGLIIGWINAVLSLIVLVGSIITITLIAIGYEQVDNTNPGVVGTFIGFMVVFSLLIVYYLITFIASVMLIQAVSRRDPSRMVLFMILMAIGVILQFIQVIIGGWSTFITAFFFALLSLYWFLCIYSLHQKLKYGQSGTPYV